MRGKFKQVRPGVYRWVIDLPRGADGKRRQKTFTFEGNRQSCLMQAGEKLLAIDRREFVQTNLTLEELFRKILADSTARGDLGLKTRERYEELVRVHILPGLGQTPLSKLSADDIENFYTMLVKSGRRDGKGSALSLRTVLHIHRLLSRVFRLAFKRRLLNQNIMALVDAPKPLQAKTGVLDEAQLGRLLRAARTPTPHCVRGGSLSCDPAFYPALVFLAATGARRGECLAIRWDDINLDSGEVTISRSLEQTRAGLNFKCPKNGKTRLVHIDGFVVAMLRSYRAAQAKLRLALGAAYVAGNLVFARPDGSPYPPHTFGDAFRALVRRTDIPNIRLHDLRHTHASLLGKHGTSLKLVSDRLGHSGIAITANTYSHTFPSQDAEAGATFDAILKGELEADCDTSVIKGSLAG